MNSLASKFDKIVFHFDGNNNDPDDISALPIAAMLASSADIEDKTTFFYGNNLGEKNEDFQVEKMRKSAAFAEKLGIDTVDYQQNINAATDKLVNIFNSGSKVLSIEGGPMEAVYRALAKTSASNRQNITLLSHSYWNENRDVINRAGVTQARTWSDLKNDFPEVNFIEIDDQNPGFYHDGWNWLDSSKNPIFNEARDLMISSNKRNDPSDAGMLFYALTGNENANPWKAKDFFEDNPPQFASTSTPTPKSGRAIYLAQNGQVVIEAENTQLQGDWEKVTVDGSQAVLWDASQSSYGQVPKRQTLSYVFKTDEGGKYNIALNSARRKSVMNSGELFHNGQARTDTGNDVYVALVEEKTGGVIQSPTKLYTGLGHSDEQLNWGNTFDKNHHKSPAQVDLKANTEYRLEISGRSDGYVIDRITLSNDGFLKDTNVAESKVKEDSTSSSPNPIVQNSDDSSLDLEFDVTNQWNGGFTGDISFTNNGKYFQGWEVEFEANFEINKIWNAEIVSHQGNRYVIKDVRSNDNVYAGETTTFGFVAKGQTGANDFTFNGQELDIDSGIKDDNDDDDKKTSFSQPSLSSKAISVGFENHSDDAKYNKSAQSKDWQVHWSNSSWMDNYAQISDDEAKSGENSLRITYRPDTTTGGSAAWKLPTAKEYYLSYWVKFENNFDFDGDKHSGGKLPGLAGAGGYCSGGATCNGNNGFSARYMWGQNGQARLYLYHMDKPGQWGENFDFKDDDGDTLYFERGKWHNLIQRVKINDGNASNGEIDVWMDGEQVLALDDLKLATNNKGIDALMFNTFHGGSSTDWLPDHKQYSYFDDVVVSTEASDVGLSA